MRDDYKFKGPTKKIEVDIENEVSEKIGLMSKYTKLSVSEITNTALKRFISAHNDYLPPKEERQAQKS